MLCIKLRYFCLSTLFIAVPTQSFFRKTSGWDKDAAKVAAKTIFFGVTVGLPIALATDAALTKYVYQQSRVPSQTECDQLFKEAPAVIKNNEQTIGYFERLVECQKHRPMTRIRITNPGEKGPVY